MRQTLIEIVLLLSLLAVACGSSNVPAGDKNEAAGTGTADESIGAEGVGETAVIDLNSALVAHYPFDGDAADASGSGNDGIVHGATPTTDRNGRDNHAYAFDGTKDYIEIPYNDNRSLDLTATATLSLWVQPAPQSAAGAYYTLLEKSDPERGGHARYGLWLIDDHVEFCLQPASTDFQHCLRSNEPLSMNDWHHVVATYDNGLLSLYLNGTKSGEDQQAFDVISQTPFELFIGSDLYSEQALFLTGSIDDVRVYKRVLSVTEIERLFELDE